jgi:hypothetical protein
MAIVAALPVASAVAQAQSCPVRSIPLIVHQAGVKRQTVYRLKADPVRGRGDACGVGVVKPTQQPGLVHPPAKAGCDGKVMMTAVPATSTRAKAAKAISFRTKDSLSLSSRSCHNHPPARKSTLP